MEGFFLRELCFFFFGLFFRLHFSSQLLCFSAFPCLLFSFSASVFLCFSTFPCLPASPLSPLFCVFFLFVFFFVSLLLWGASNSLALVGFAAEPNPRVWLIALALPWSCALLPFDWPLSASARVLFSDYFDICNSFSFFTSAVCGPLVDCIFGLRY